MNNLEIAELLRAVAAAYQLRDEQKNKFKIIAYQRAADAVEHASSELKDLWDEGKLEDVPGIGKSIAQHLDELFRTGKSKHFVSLMKDFPPQLFKIMDLPGVGAKTAFKLVKGLHISSGKPLEQLKKAANKGQIARLEGFGEQTERDILKAIQEIKDKVKRYLLPYALLTADDLASWMKKNPKVNRVDPLGSLRRKASTIGDIDIAVSSDQAKEVIDHFCKYPKTQRIIEKGERTASILLPGGIQVDIMVQPTSSYGSLLQHFTGSKHHNIALREYALKKGLSLSEYGIKSLKGSAKEVTSYATEELFYKALGMDWIEPELREDSGEIEAAVNHKLPKLVKLETIKADLQIHSSFDIETSHDLGLSSMEEIVAVAGKLGYDYLAFTEHNPSRSGHSDSQIMDILKRKKEKVDKLNYSLVKNMKHRVKKVFNSLEVDILPDGGLAVSEQGLETLDFVLVSIHSSFRLNRNEMTKRVISALDHPKAKIFAHPTARKLNEREGIELNWPAIFEFCHKNNKWLEINADPVRLDLPDFLVKEAVKAGLKLTLGTDSHHKDNLYNMPYGVAVARRGWAEAKDIVNALKLEDFEKVLK